MRTLTYMALAAVVALACPSVASGASCSSLTESLGTRSGGTELAVFPGSSGKTVKIAIMDITTGAVTGTAPELSLSASLSPIMGANGTETLKYPFLAPFGAIGIWRVTFTPELGGLVNQSVAATIQNIPANGVAAIDLWGCLQ